MKKVSKISIMSISIILLILLANGCIKSASQSKSEAIIPSPDKIILYSLGKTKEVKKGDKEFDKINTLTIDRVDIKNLSIVQATVNDEIITGKKNIVMAVEFIYNKEYELIIKGDRLNSIKYNKLFFELFDPSSSAMLGGPGHTIFQYGDLKHYKDSSIGPLKEPKELITVVKSIIN